MKINILGSRADRLTVSWKRRSRRMKARNAIILSLTLFFFFFLFPSPVVPFFPPSPLSLSRFSILDGFIRENFVRYKIIHSFELISGFLREARDRNKRKMN